MHDYEPWSTDKSNHAPRSLSNRASEPHAAPSLHGAADRVRTAVSGRGASPIQLSRDIQLLHSTLGNRAVGKMVSGAKRGISPQAKAAEGAVIQMKSDKGHFASGDQVVQLDKDDVSAEDLEIVKERAKQRTGADLVEEDVFDPSGKALQSKKAMVVRGASMAKDPEFEAAAEKWEEKLGFVAYNDARAKKPVDDGAKKAVDYLTQKCGEWDKDNALLKKELAKVDVKWNAWSGGVGAETEKVMRAFTAGSFGVKVVHLENFVNKLISQDLLDRDDKGMEELLEAAQIDKDGLAAGAARIRNTRNTRALHDVKGDALLQAHTRTLRHPPEANANANANANAQHGLSKRTVKDLADMGLDLSDDEKAFMNVQNPEDKLPWLEGAELLALNERDKWVFAMRQLSLPLAAGVSGSAARLMQNFSFLGVGNPADNRLACIAYLLPTRHHSLIEVLAAADKNGGPEVEPGPMMYRKIEPYSEKDLRDKVGPFPDEVVEEQQDNEALDNE